MAKAKRPLVISATGLGGGPVSAVVPHRLHLVEGLLHDVHHRLLGASPVPALDRLGDVGVQPESPVLGVPRHQPVVVPTGQHLSNELVQLHEHVVAGASEHLPVELDVETQELVVVALLAGSGNDMFVKLHELVAEVLAGRHHYGLMPRYPQDGALRLHADVAQAIQRGDGDRAQEAMVHIMQQALDEMKSMWDGEPDGSSV
jgi:hypothetical protein